MVVMLFSTPVGQLSTLPQPCHCPRNPCKHIQPANSRWKISVLNPLESIILPGTSESTSTNSIASPSGTGNSGYPESLQRIPDNL